MNRPTCKTQGYKVGDKFKVVNLNGQSMHTYDNNSLEVGDIVTLKQDDGTCCPLFEHPNHPQIGVYLYLWRLEKIIPLAPWFDGELPPIGTECVFNLPPQYARMSSCPLDGATVTIINHISGGKNPVKRAVYTYLQSNGHLMVSSAIAECFSRIKTPEQIEEEALALDLKKVSNILPQYRCEEVAHQLYAQGYRKVNTGMEGK